MPVNERRYLLTRCLRLESRIDVLERELIALRPRPRYLTDADRSAIRDLHNQGASLRTIAAQLHRGTGTIWNVIHPKP